jgi:hypothetical protein
MNKKPPMLPNIEDATLKACLAPLMEAINPAVETVAPLTQAFASPVVPAMRAPGLPHGPAGSNDNPLPTEENAAPRVPASCGMPTTLTEWRSLADDEFGAFRTIEHFLSMTDAELEEAAAEFPRQISGTVGRISRIKKRLVARYDAVTTVVALLERAIARVEEGSAIEEREPLPLTGD